MIRVLVLGDLNLDVMVEETTPTAAGDELRSAVRAAPGGSAGTFARVAARLGARATFLGAVGTDAVGDLLEADLRRAGVEPRLTRSPLPTGVVVALHRAGDRTMICSRGANDALDEGYVDPALFAAINHVHISGYAFLSPSQARAARRAIDLARDAGASVSVNPPPANLLVAHGADRFRQSLTGVTHLILNRGEGRCLTGADEDGAIVDDLAHTCGTGALTLGAEGALAWREGERNWYESEETLNVDPTGAGDAYAASLVVSLLDGQTLTHANRRACQAARDHIAQRLVARASA